VPVEVRSTHPGTDSARRRLRQSAGHFLKALEQLDKHLSILLVGDVEIRRLNRTWRGKDRATDVLSFPQPHEPGNGPVLGDVVISMETAVRRAKQDGRPVGRELDRYLAHGLLHLLGFDHEKPAEAKQMAAREAELIGTAGLIGTALQKSVPLKRGARRAVKAGAGRRRARK
jgi:probable rRNA maturation factor